MRKILKRITAFALSVLLTCTAGATDLLDGISGITAQAASTTYVDGEDVVTEALKVLKTPYVWGGTSTSGMDCSGMVYYVLQKVGIKASSIPRDTASWASAINNGTLALKDNNGNTISVTVKKYSSGYAAASDVKPGTIILQNGHMSICAGVFEGNTGSTPQYGVNFQWNTLLSIRDQMLAKYGSSVSGLSSKLTVDAANQHFYMHGSYCTESTYNKIWRIEAIGNSSNTASNPGRGVSLSNSKNDKNGSATVVATITFDKPTKGKVKFSKTGSNTQEAVKGATYAVYPSSMSDSDVKKRGTSNRITTFITGNDGAATVDLDAGTYKAIEITAPSGFELSDKVYAVRVSSNTTVNQSVTDDEKPFTLRLKKTDSATGKAITGAEFTVYLRQPKSGTLPSGWKETASYYWKPYKKMAYNSSTGYYEASGLYPDDQCSGNIRVYETKAQEGYVLNSSWYWEVKALAPATSYSGTLQRVNYGSTATYNGSSGSANSGTTVQNTPQAVTMRLKKTDAVTKKALTDAVFTAYERQEKSGSLPSGWKETPNYYWKPVKKLTYNSSTGYYEASGLQATAANLGYFRVYETAAPEGYNINSSWYWEARALDPSAEYTGSLTRINYGGTGTYEAEDGSNALADIPKSISLSLAKTDAVTGSKVDGAVFTVYERQEKTGTLPEGWIESPGFYWKPVTAMTNSSDGIYKASGLQSTESNNGYFRVYETAAPEGYARADSWYWEVRAYTESYLSGAGVQYIQYGTTGSYGQYDDAVSSLENTPQPFGVSIDKRDGDTMEVLTGVTFTIYSRMPVSAANAKADGWKEDAGYYWAPYASLAYNSATQKYDAVILPDGTQAAGLVPDGTNQGYFRIYETAPQDDTYVPFDGFWEVRGYTESGMQEDGVQYIRYGTVGSYGEYTDSPYMFNYSDDTNITVQKIWNDAADRDGLRPGSVTVTLKAALADGTPVDLAALMGADAPAAQAAAADEAAMDMPAAETSEETSAETEPESRGDTAYEAGTEAEETSAEETATDGSLGTAGEETAADSTAEPSPETVGETSLADTGASEPQTDDVSAAGISLLSAAADADTASPFTVTLSSANGWKHTFEGLPLKAEGQAIRYSIVEEDVPAGYTVSYRASGTYLTAVNTHTPETVQVPVHKIWDDRYNKDGIRPASVTVRLYADGKEVNAVELNSGNSWGYTFTTDSAGKPLYKNAQGKEISYTVSEDAVEGYTTGITIGSGDVRYITNTHIPYTTVSVNKIWDDYSNAAGTRPGFITVRLYADGTEVNAVQVTAALGWAYTFTADSAGNPLEKYHRDGTEIAYTVSEDAVENYTTAEPEGNAEAGYTITNTYREYIQIPVTKVWEDYSDAAGLRPEDVAVRLYADGIGIVAARLNESNSWQHTFTVDASGKALPKYHDDGTPVVYTIKEYALNEGDLDAYTPSYTGSIEAGFTITNTHKEYVSIPVEKTWDDRKDAAGKRPDTITVRLYADSTEIGSAQVKETDGWAYTFTADTEGNLLEKYTPEGTEILYTVSEDTVEGYTPDIEDRTFALTEEGWTPEDRVEAADGEEDTKTSLAVTTGYVITNTYREYVEIPVSKSWSDGADRDGIRPESILVRLYADGTQVNYAVLSDETGWNKTFATDRLGKKLEKYDAEGNTISYTVKEDAVEGYSGSITWESQKGYLILNTHTPETTSITVNKTWNDAGFSEGERPESITVHLYADGKEINKAVLTAETGWTCTFTKDAAGTPLYRYRDGGVSISYTIREDVPAGWMAEISANGLQYGIVNTPTVLKVSKQDITTGREVPGASLEIYAADAEGNKTGEALYSWVSADTPHVIHAIPAGDYILTEVLAPEEDGYIKAADMNFTITETGDVQGVVMQDDYTKVEISKTDITTGEEITGAKLTITDAEGNTVAEWTTDGNPHRINYIAPGEYTLTETAAPDGYVIAESVTFTVEATGEIQKVEMKDDYTKVEISKTDITTGKEITGAELTIADRDGNTVAEWVTDGEPHRIDYLPAGEYTLTEVAAPDGYVIAESVTFTVEATGEIQKVEMKDDYTKVEISKTDITTGEEITGAKLTITDAEGNTAAEWTTDGNPHRINYMAPGEYTLTETAAPDGYVIAESVTFTVEATGEIQKVEMKDDYTKVEISKTDITTGEEITGAKLTITDAEGNTVAEWTTDGTPHRINYMAPGEYILTETAAPDGYVIAESITFTVEATGEIQKVNMKDDYTKVEISKTDLVTGEELTGARLVLKKADGTTVAEWTTDGTPHRIDYLVPGEYILTELSAPDGYQLAESVTFTVDATGEIQKVEMKDAPLDRTVSQITPILGIEDTTSGLALILMALAVFVGFLGMMMFVKRHAEK